MMEIFNGHTFLVHSSSVVWIEYALQQKLDSEAGVGFDVALADRLQSESGWVAGEFRNADGSFRRLYSQPRGFPQNFHLANWESEGPYRYLVDEKVIDRLPIVPSQVSEPLVMVRIELPQQDISWQFSHDYPGPVMEEIPLNDDQRAAILGIIDPLGELYDDSFEPLIVASWESRDALITRLKVLAPVE